MRTVEKHFHAFYLVAFLLSLPSAWAQSTPPSSAPPVVTSTAATTATRAAASTGTSPAVKSAAITLPDISKNTALVIIDMQPMFVTRGGNEKDAENQKKVKTLLDTQLLAIQSAEKKHLPIVFLEYEGFGDTNATLKKAIAKYKNVTFIPKNTDGMFESDNTHEKQLASYLEKNKVKTLLITGANGGACVLESIRGALEKNYNVVAVTDGIADFNFDKFIYPYSNRSEYSELKPTCKDCSFRQVDNLQPIFRAPAGVTEKDCDPHPELNVLRKTGHFMIQLLEGKK